MSGLYKFPDDGQWPPNKSLPWLDRIDRSSGSRRSAIYICLNQSSEREESSRAARPCHQSSSERALALVAAAGKNRHRIRAKHGRASGFADAHAPLTNVLLAALNFGLELLGELQLVFEHVGQPIEQRFLFSFGPQLNLIFDLFQRKHGTFKPESRVFATQSARDRYWGVRRLRRFDVARGFGGLLCCG